MNVMDAMLLGVMLAATSFSLIIPALEIGRVTVLYPLLGCLHNYEDYESNYQEHYYGSYERRVKAQRTVGILEFTIWVLSE